MTGRMYVFAMMIPESRRKEFDEKVWSNVPLGSYCWGNTFSFAQVLDPDRFDVCGKAITIAFNAAAKKISEE